MRDEDRATLEWGIVIVVAVIFGFKLLVWFTDNLPRCGCT